MRDDILPPGAGVIASDELDRLRAENERLRHRVHVARSTVELLWSYTTMLHAGGIDDGVLSMARGESERAIETWRALTEPDAPGAAPSPVEGLP